MHFRHMFLALILGVATPAAAAPKHVRPAPKPHNAILFVSDGLRYESIDPKLGFVTAADVDAYLAVRKAGVDFANTHSLYPTLTTANASAIATGHYLGDTGDFANSIAAAMGGDDPRVGLENDAHLAAMNAAYGGNYLNEPSLLAMARAKGMSVAVIGKEGPAAIQDLTALGDNTALQNGDAIVIDDETVIDPATGKQTGGPTLAADILAAMVANKLFKAPDASIGAGYNEANLAAESERETFFATVAAKVVLPILKKRGKPFVVTVWSPDPDWSQHLAAGAATSAVPGINGPAAVKGIQNANAALHTILTAMHALRLNATTDLFLTADHGFSTITQQPYVNGQPSGDALKGAFVADALAAELKLPNNKKGLLGSDPTKPDVIVAPNGGSDLIYIPNVNGKRERAAQIVRFLLAQPYAGAVFINDDVATGGSASDFAGAQAMSAINFIGSAKTPRPDIVVSFASFVAPECTTKGYSDNICAAEIASSSLTTGQGMHGTSSRADTRNFMAAMGPDFARGCVDQLPVSNADITPTLAHVLRLDFGAAAKGGLRGRVIAEVLDRCSRTVRPVERTDAPPAARADGNNTMLQYQIYEGRRYIDAAGVPGRAVGLSFH